MTLPARKERRQPEKKKRIQILKQQQKKVWLKEQRMRMEEDRSLAKSPEANSPTRFLGT